MIRSRRLLRGPPWKKPAPRSRTAERVFRALSSLRRCRGKGLRSLVESTEEFSFLFSSASCPVGLARSSGAVLAAAGNCSGILKECHSQTVFIFRGAHCELVAPPLCLLHFTIIVVIRIVLFLFAGVPERSGLSLGSFRSRLESQYFFDESWQRMFEGRMPRARCCRKFICLKRDHEYRARMLCDVMCKVLS